MTPAWLLTVGWFWEYGGGMTPPWLLTVGWFWEYGGGRYVGTAW